jgi:hypothetical protein
MVSFNQRRPQRVHAVLDIDFRKGFCKDDFVMMLGSDGCASSDGDGLTVNSSFFQDSQPVGEHGWLDHHKWTGYYKSPVEIHCSQETIFETKIANKQIFDEANPVPIEFRSRITDMFADPRLAHGQFTVIDPQTGMMTGYMITDHQLFVVYGRNTNLSVLRYKDAYATECEPCKAQCDEKFGCSDFWQDCRYQDFKQNATEPQFRRFVEYLAWYASSNKNGIALTNFKIFCAWRKQNPVNCDMLSRQDYVAWKSHYEWQEYCAFLAGWEDWFRQYKDWECCAEECLPETCTPGECSKRIFGGPGSTDPCKRDSCSSCYHVYTRDGKSCYDSAVQRPAEEFPYQFGACRSCCCAKPANFVNLIPVLRTEACDPLCDFIKVAVGIDRKYKTFKYYVNNQEVFKVVDIGRRLNDMYAVIEHGGYAESVDMQCALVCFGTGTLLDASLPNNYSRMHAKNQKDESALVPLMGIDYYYSSMFNKAGEKRFVDPSHFAVVAPDIKFRCFKQGDVLKIQYISVLVRPASRDYPSLRSYCGFRTCCGPNNGNDCGPNCGDDDGCCYGGDLDDNQGCFDPRNLDVEFYREGRGGNQCPSENGETSCGTQGPVKARLVRTPKSKRYWEANCKTPGFGEDPYI